MTKIGQKTCRLQSAMTSMSLNTELCSYRYIECLEECAKGSDEYCALCGEPSLEFGQSSDERFEFFRIFHWET